MKKIVAILLTVTALSGCASIIKGKTQNINVMTSDGSEVNATIFTKNGMRETTLPQLVSVQKDSQDITIQVKEGKCNRETVSVATSSVEPWFWGNFIIGGIFGSTTDSVTGAMWKYDSTVIVNVNKKAQCLK
jgi:uncharacterized protein YceK